MLEEERHALAVVRSPAGFGELGLSQYDRSGHSKIRTTHSRRDIKRDNPVAQLLLLLVRYGVGHDQVLELAVVDLLDGVAAEDAVGDDGDGGFGAVLDNHVGGLAQRAAGVGHVVDDDGGAVFHVADQHHAADLVGARALLVDEREADVEVVGDGGRSVAWVSANVHICVRRQLSVLTSSLRQRRARRSRSPVAAGSPGST